MVKNDRVLNLKTQLSGFVGFTYGGADRPLDSPAHQPRKFSNTFHFRRNRVWPKGLCQVLGCVVQQLSGNDQALDFTGTFVDIGDAGVAEPLFHQVVVGDSHGA